MRIAHLSDFHVFAGERPELIRPDIADVVKTIVADVAAFRPSIDLCMLTGDLAGNAVPEDYRLLRELLEPLPMPMYAVPGNHDAREPFKDAFRDILPFTDHPDCRYDAVYGPVRILALDTVLAGSDSGALNSGQLAWLEEKLAVSHDGPTYILMHHAPYECGVRFLDEIELVEGGDSLARIIASAKTKPRILCGHIHRPSVTCWNGAFAMVGGSPAFTIELDLSGSQEEPAVENAPYAYFIHHLDRSGGFAVSPRYVEI